MNLKKITLASLFIAIGFLFRMVTPPVLLGMKPDFLLSMMFITILLSDDYKMTLLIGTTVGILAAATTTFPGGQIAQMVDKLITCQCVFAAFKLTRGKINKQIRIIVISFLGTILSGSIFLNTVGLLFGLPGGKSFALLFMGVVIPAAVADTIIAAIVYNAVLITCRRLSLSSKF